MFSNDMVLHGHVAVCSVTTSSDGKFRYGLQCQIDDGSDDLHRMLPKIATALQVKQLELMTWGETDLQPNG